jgi:hypothetical protein
MLSIGKLAAGQAKYYLDQAEGRVDVVESVRDGLEDYYAGGSEARGEWLGMAALGAERASPMRRVPSSYPVLMLNSIASSIAMDAGVEDTSSLIVAILRPSRRSLASPHVARRRVHRRRRRRRAAVRLVQNSDVTWTFEGAEGECRSTQASADFMRSQKRDPAAVVIGRSRSRRDRGRFGPCPCRRRRG